MNPLNLSPAARAFWASIIRHLLTAVGAVLVTHGYVSKSDASAYEEELIGVIIGSAATVWANRATYWNQIRHLVGRAMPAGTTEVAVTAKVAELKDAGTLPSVFTPPTVTPTLVSNSGKVAAIFLALALGAGAVTSTSCAAKTAPNVDPVAARQHQALKVLNAVKQVGLVVEQVQLGEEQLFLAGQVPAAVHADIKKAFDKTATAVLIASDTLAKAVATTDPVVVVQALAGGLKDISAALAHLSPKQGAQLAGWIDTAAALIEVALS